MSAPPQHWRSNPPAWRNPLGLLEPSAVKSLAWALVMLALAVAFGVATVVFGNVFADRPLLLLALPLLIVLAFTLVLTPGPLLVALVLLRAALNPVFEETRLPGFGGLGGVLNLVVIGLALMLAVRSAVRMPRLAWTPWLPFLALVALNLARAPDLVPAVRNLAVLLTYCAVFYCAFHCVKNGVELDRMLTLLLLSSVPVLVYTAVSYFTGGATTFQLESDDGPTGRLTGPFTHPNILGFYLVIMVAAWLAKARSLPGQPFLTSRNLAWWAYMGLLLVLLMGTQSRGPWIGALFLFLVYGAFVQRSYLLFIGAGMLAALAVPEVRDRVLDLASNNEVYTYSKLNSFAWRQYLWSCALAWMPPVSYLIGNGMGAFWFYSLSFFPLSGGNNWAAHNVYMQLLFDLGAVGVLAFLALFAFPFVALWKSRAPERRVRLIALALLPSFAMMCYADNMLDYLVVNWNFWFLVGLVLASALRAPAPQKTAWP